MNYVILFFNKNKIIDRLFIDYLNYCRDFGEKVLKT